MARERKRKRMREENGGEDFERERSEREEIERRA